ncbi:MAG: hypothetical protein K2F83_03260 [Oscillospiraceae bacterium]|nr:hypothetical protein [Oscillospiraceae bacterium]
MGVFLQVLLFPDGKEADCRTALQEAAADPEMALSLDECLWHLYNKGPAVLLNEGSLGYDVLTRRLSDLLSSPVMNLYIYDDDYWGYWVYQQGTEVASFASLPDYFKPGSPPNRPGNAPLLARLFHTDPQDLLPYLAPWREDEIELDLFARDGDSAVIGDSWQMADFMGALGFDFDTLCPPPPVQETVRAPQEANILTSVPTPVTGYGAPVDSPELPTALTHLPYALERLSEAEDIAAEAVQFIRDMQYQSALPLLTAAIGAHPDCPALYVLRAFCWNQLENISTLSRKPDMDRDMTKLLELEPDNILALRARCPTTGTSSRYKRHIEDLTRLMALDPESRDYYQVSRAYRHHWLGDDQAAKADLQEVLDRGKIWTVDFTYLCRELGLLG